jgi:hypothetical protein
MGMAGPADLVGLTFSSEQCDALFAAVLVHDDYFPDAVLPEHVRLDYTQEQLGASYGLCLQLWRTGTEWPELAKIVRGMSDAGGGDVATLQAFKDFRARFKHLHFACHNVDARHAYPRWLHWFTGIMGEMLDGFKYGKTAVGRRYGLVLRLFMTRGPRHMIEREVDQFTPCTTESFRAYVKQQIDELRALLAKTECTGKQFHDGRKVVSRMVAFYDDMKILYPTPDHDALTQVFSSINGLMGSMHDDLVERKMNGTLDYKQDLFALPDTIRSRLTDIARAFP